MLVKSNRMLALATVMSAVVAIAGCSGKSSAALDLATGVDHVALTITGPENRPAQNITKIDDTHYQVTVLALLAGSGYMFSVQGFDASNQEVLNGQATNVTINAGQTAAVNIVLTETNPVTAVNKRLPVLEGLSASSALVPQNTVVALSVTAHSPESHTLTYQWSDSCGGTFDAATATSTNWTSPGVDGTCQLSVRIVDATNVTTVTGYLVIVVQTVAQTGDANVNATVDTYPIMSIGVIDEFVVFQTPAPGSLSLGITADIQATASDPDGTVVNHLWTATCDVGTSSFSPSADELNVTFHNTSPKAVCTLTLTATDGSQSIVGTVELSGYRCANVTCDAGQACDPQDGLCHVVDACSGVTCPPASDVCHVAGVCVTGTCQPETVVVCPIPGDVCDPAHTPPGCYTPTTATAPVVERADGHLVTAYGLAYGADGAIYRAGELSEAFDFGSGIVNTAGSSDLWLGQFDPTGTGLAVPALWAPSYGDTNDSFATGIARSSDQLGIIAKFTGTLDLGAGFSRTNPDPDIVLPTIALFDPATHAATYMTTVNLNGGLLAQIASNPLTNRFAVCGTAQDIAATGLVPGAVMGGGMDIVVAVLDETGIVWAKQIGGTGNQTCSAVTLDDSGDVIIAGTYSAGALDFGAGAFASPISANQHVYVDKFLGANGDFVRAVGFGPASGSSGRSVANGVAVAANGDVALVGSVLGRITFGGITIIGTGTASADAYAVKLNAADYSVATGWPVRIGGSQADAANAVTIDSQNRVWVAGIFNGTTTSPGPDSRGAVAVTSNGGAG